MKVTTHWAMIGMLTLTMFGCHITNPTLREKAINAKKDGNTERALKLYSKALSQIDTDWRAMEGIANIRFEQQNWIDAQLGYEKIISLQPDNARVSHWLDRVAECLFKQGRADALQDMLRNANEQYGSSSDFLRQANYLTKVGDMDQAQVAYRKAVHFADKTDDAPWIAMAAFYELVGDKGQAIEALRRAHAINPANLSVADRLRHYGIVPGPAAGIQPTPAVPPLPQVEQVVTETAPAE
ncbi:MAG TPA: hypothetical protein DCM28_07600 [Phycisphaerales bacterium]|mgnify:CR=1 FL=1|nr:hypothetical protein [Phycisphaerales bacterium]HCD33217.1 hypothetical protein [Phycisphaerales bacterium]|tara:strand:+ start:1404 stop:2123 length:720 start_codon:yes stop_codon:yes gene_type:complete